MRAALEAVPGVRVIRISFSDELAVVRYDEQTATVADMVAALEAAGFKGWDTTGETRLPGGSAAPATETGDPRSSPAADRPAPR